MNDILERIEQLEALAAASGDGDFTMWAVFAAAGAPYRPRETAVLIAALLNDALPIMRALVADNAALREQVIDLQFKVEDAATRAFIAENFR